MKHKFILVSFIDANNPKLSFGFTITILINLYITPLLMKNKNNPKSNYITKKASEHSFTSNSPSEYSFKDVLHPDEFHQLSQEIHLDSFRSSQLADIFYPSHSSKKYQQRFERQPVVYQPSEYKMSYDKWKEDSQNKANSQPIYQKALNLIKNDNNVKKINQNIWELNNVSTIYKLKEGNQRLEEIRKDHEEQVKKMTKQRSKQIQINQTPQTYKAKPQWTRSPSLNLQKQSQNIEQRQTNSRKQKIIELQFQKALLSRINKINEQQKQRQELKASQIIFRKTCFVDMIAKPPSATATSHIKETLLPKKQDKVNKHSKNNSNLIQNPHQTSSEMMDNTYTIQLNKATKQIPNKSPNKSSLKIYKLNIDEIIKIPHSLFLIFYSQNYALIHRLTTPEELKKLNEYRAQALAAFEAGQRLKKRVSLQGSSLINKLTSQQRQKLFKILYSNDVQEQKYHQRQVNR